MADGYRDLLKNLQHSVQQMQNEHDVELQKCKLEIASLSAKLKDCLDAEKNFKPCSKCPKRRAKEVVEDCESQQHIDETFESICKSIDDLTKSLPDGATSKENLEALAISLENLDGMRIDCFRWDAFREVQVVPVFTCVTSTSQLKIIDILIEEARKLDAEDMYELTEFLSMFGQILHMYVGKFGEAEEEMRRYYEEEDQNQPQA